MINSSATFTTQNCSFPLSPSLSLSYLQVLWGDHGVKRDGSLIIEHLITPPSHGADELHCPNAIVSNEDFLYDSLALIAMYKLSRSRHLKRKQVLSGVHDASPNFLLQQICLFYSRPAVCNSPQAHLWSWRRRRACVHA